MQTAFTYTCHAGKLVPCLSTSQCPHAVPRMHPVTNTTRLVNLAPHFGEQLSLEQHVTGYRLVRAEMAAAGAQMWVLQAGVWRKLPSLPAAGFGGFSGMVNSLQPTGYKQAAYDIFTFFGSPAVSLPVSRLLLICVYRPRASPGILRLAQAPAFLTIPWYCSFLQMVIGPTLVGPFRNSHLSTDDASLKLWAAKGYNTLGATLGIGQSRLARDGILATLLMRTVRTGARGKAGRLLVAA